MLIAFVVHKFSKPKEIQEILKSQSEEPLEYDSDKHFLRNWAMDDWCYGITPYSNIKNEELLVLREKMIKNVIEAKFNVEGVLDELVEEIEVKEEVRRMKVRDKKLRVKEKAEMSAYGKVKSKRLPLYIDIYEYE